MHLTNRPRESIGRVLASATALCLLNALKPLALDDPAYYALAEQIAAHPLDPYGFSLFWYQHPSPAHEVLAPPVFPYWWALGIRWLGDSPLLWKLWLWPWCILLATGLDALLCRFARPLAAPLLWMTMLSPSVLPALNLMLDVPCLALSLAAVAAFLAARDRGAWSGAVGAGVLTGLAMQTKYTALLVPPTLLLAAWFGPRRKSLWLGITAASVAACMFAAWEVFVAVRYGSSHLFYHLSQSRSSWAGRLNLVAPLMSLLGGVAAPVGLLGLTAWGVRTRWVAFAAALFVAGLALLAWGPEWDSRRLSNNTIVFGSFGVLTGVVLLGTTAALLGHRGPESERPDDRFLALWWLVELAGSFALTPWPAARRVLGLVVVGTLLLGRWAARTGHSPDRVRLVRSVAAFGVALGLLFQAIDVDNATAERDAVAIVNAWVRERDPIGQVWFLSHWGLKFYGERAGWRPVIPDRSRLSAGSWLVVPARESGHPQIDVPDTAVHEGTVTITSRWPLSTIPWYYGTNKPLHRQAHPILTVAVYCIMADCTPRTPPGGGQHPP